MGHKDIDDIDEVEFLAALDRLAKEAGDWRQHLPYEALRQYRECRAIRDKFGEHADSCSYCQELIGCFGE